MSVIDRLSRLQGYIKAILAFIALLPSIATIINLLEIPVRMAQLVTFLFGFVGIGIVLLMAILSDQIREMRAAAAALLLIATLIGGMISAIAYVQVAERHVVTVEWSDDDPQVLVPLDLSANLKAAKAAFGGDLHEALNTSRRRQQLLDEMRENSGTAETLMIVLLVLAQGLLVSSIAFAAWRASLNDPAPPPAPVPSG